MVPLKPFAAPNVPIALAAELNLAGPRLEFRFTLEDPAHAVLDGLVPGAYLGRELVRADLLWQTTCFEAFWGIPGQPGYWEMNLAGTGKKWNCYGFTGYRTPAPPAPSLEFQMESTRVEAGSISCVLLAQKPLPRVEASLAAVVRTQHGNHYFATQHAGERPDFHLRESFVVQRG